MHVSVSSSEIARLKASIQGTARRLQVELAVAVNATAAKSKSIINKEIRKELATSATAVKKTISTRGRAKPGNPRVAVEVRKTARIPLRDFGARQTKKGVTYKISKTTGRKLIAGAFQGPKPGAMKASWKGNVFKRVGKSRLPIVKLYGPSPWGVFVVGKRMGPSVDETQKELTKQVHRRIRFITLKKRGVI